MLGSLTALIPAGPTSVLVHGPADGPGASPGIVADRLAAALRAAGRPCVRLSHPGDAWAGDAWAGDSGETIDQVLLGDGARWRGTRRWNVVIWLRTAAIAEARLCRGGVVVDAGCGTGRAVPALRESVGAFGKILAVDVTPEMLDRARPRCEAARAALVLADARRLPMADGAADTVFAAGLVTHLPDTAGGSANSRGSPGPTASSCYSTRPGARRSPPGTAGRCGRTSRSPTGRCVG